MLAGNGVMVFLLSITILTTIAVKNKSNRDERGLSLERKLKRMRKRLGEKRQ